MGPRRTKKVRIGMRTGLRRTVMFKREERKEQLEVGGELGRRSFTKFKRKGFKEKKIGMSFTWLSSQEVRR